MKKLIPAIVIAFCSVGIASCSNVQGQNLEAEHKNAIASVTIPQSKQASSQQPQVGTVTSMTNGDLLCYVTLLDENGTEHNVGADFEICANEDTFLNKKVRAFYETVPVNDCQSAEPCGKTRQESIITKMEVVGEGQSTTSGNSQTVSNGEWTITIGNLDSWSGVNGTGNLSYSGCDSKGNCIDLNGGQVTCRNGICTTAWRNGAYSYVLEQPIDNPDAPEASESSTTLTVRKGSAVILRATGFQVVP